MKLSCFVQASYQAEKLPDTRTSIGINFSSPPSNM